MINKPQFEKNSQQIAALLSNQFYQAVFCDLGKNKVGRVITDGTSCSLSSVTSEGPSRFCPTDHNKS